MASITRRLDDLVKGFELPAKEFIEDLQSDILLNAGNGQGWHQSRLNQYMNRLDGDLSYLKRYYN